MGLTAYSQELGTAHSHNGGGSAELDAGATAVSPRSPRQILHASNQHSHSRSSESERSTPGSVASVIRGWLGRVPTGTRHVVDRGSDVKYGSAEVACPSADHQHAQHAVLHNKTTGSTTQQRAAPQQAQLGSRQQQAASARAAGSWQQASKHYHKHPPPAARRGRASNKHGHGRGSDTTRPTTRNTGTGTAAAANKT